MRNLLYVVGMLLLLSGGAFAQDKTNPPERFETDFRVVLPMRPVPSYSLEELAQVLSKQSGREVYVDTRVKEKLLLVQLPEGVPLSANTLLEAMGKTTRLLWRRVDSVLFLTLYEEGALQKFGAAKQQEMRQTKDSIFKSVIEHFGALPDAVNNFQGATQQRWNDLSRQERGDLFSLFSRAESSEGTKPLRLSDLADGTFWFTFSLQLVVDEGGRTSGTGLRIMN